MYQVLGRILALATPKPDDSMTDRWNYSVTAKILLFLILVISTKQFVGAPIKCWTPAEFRYPMDETWEAYILRYCFIENTYFVNETNMIFPSVPDRPKAELRYYQWIPIFLSIQLVLFMAVRAFWSAASESTGLDVRSIVVEIPFKNVKRFKDGMRLYGYLIRDTIKFESNADKKYLKIIPYTSYFTFKYLCYKLLSCVNVLGQLFLMNYYLNTEYTFWGFDILWDLIIEKGWKESGHFPRITFCDFFRRDETSSAPINFPIQCVMMINMFNEKIYILLWFWFVILAVSNIVSTLYWFSTSLLPCYRRRWITKKLKQNGTYIKSEDEITKFIDNLIPLDALLCLRLIRHNCGKYVGAGITGEMFDTFHNRSTVGKKPPKKDEEEDDEESGPEKIAPEELFDTYIPPHLQGNRSSPLTDSTIDSGFGGGLGASTSTTISSTSSSSTTNDDENDGKKLQEKIDKELSNFEEELQEKFIKDMAIVFKKHGIDEPDDDDDDKFTLWMKHIWNFLKIWNPSKNYAEVDGDKMNLLDLNKFQKILDGLDHSSQESTSSSNGIILPSMNVKNAGTGGASESKQRREFKNPNVQRENESLVSAAAPGGAAPAGPLAGPSTGSLAGTSVGPAKYASFGPPESCSTTLWPIPSPSSSESSSSPSPPPSASQPRPYYEPYLSSYSTDIKLPSPSTIDMDDATDKVLEGLMESMGNGDEYSKMIGNYLNSNPSPPPPSSSKPAKSPTDKMPKPSPSVPSKPVKSSVDKMPKNASPMPSSSMPSKPRKASVDKMPDTPSSSSKVPSKPAKTSVDKMPSSKVPSKPLIKTSKDQKIHGTTTTPKPPSIPPRAQTPQIPAAPSTLAKDLDTIMNKPSTTFKPVFDAASTNDTVIPEDKFVVPDLPSALQHVPGLDKDHHNVFSSPPITVADTSIPTTVPPETPSSPTTVPTPSPTVSEAGSDTLPKFDEPFSTPNILDEQKPINEAEAKIGMMGGGLFQGITKAVGSVFGFLKPSTYYSSLPEPSSSSTSESELDSELESISVIGAPEKSVEASVDGSDNKDGFARIKLDQPNLGFEKFDENVISGNSFLSADAADKPVEASSSDANIGWEKFFGDKNGDHEKSYRPNYASPKGSESDDEILADKDYDSMKRANFEAVKNPEFVDTVLDGKDYDSMKPVSFEAAKNPELVDKNVSSLPLPSYFTVSQPTLPTTADITVSTTPKSNDGILDKLGDIYDPSPNLADQYFAPPNFEEKPKETCIQIDENIFSPSPALESPILPEYENEVKFGEFDNIDGTSGLVDREPLPPGGFDENTNAESVDENFVKPINNDINVEADDKSNDPSTTPSPTYKYKKNPKFINKRNPSLARHQHHYTTAAMPKSAAPQPSLFETVTTPEDAKAAAVDKFVELDSSDSPWISSLEEAMTEHLTNQQQPILSNYPMPSESGYDGDANIEPVYASGHPIFTDDNFKSADIDAGLVGPYEYDSDNNYASELADKSYEPVAPPMPKVEHFKDRLPSIPPLALHSHPSASNPKKDDAKAAAAAKFDKMDSIFNNPWLKSANDDIEDENTKSVDEISGKIDAPWHKSNYNNAEADKSYDKSVEASVDGKYGIDNKDGFSDSVHIKLDQPNFGSEKFDENVNSRNVPLSAADKPVEASSSDANIGWEKFYGDKNEDHEKSYRPNYGSPKGSESDNEILADKDYDSMKLGNFEAEKNPEFVDPIFADKDYDSMKPANSEAAKIPEFVDKNVSSLPLPSYFTVSQPTLPTTTVSTPKSNDAKIDAAADKLIGSLVAQQFRNNENAKNGDEAPFETVQSMFDRLESINPYPISSSSSSSDEMPSSTSTNPNHQSLNILEGKSHDDSSSDDANSINVFKAFGKND